MAIKAVKIRLLRRLLQGGSDQQVINAIEKIHPTDLSTLFATLEERETKRLIDCLLQLKKVGKVLSEISEYLLPDILAGVATEKLIDIIGRVASDEAVHILSKIPEDKWPPILDGLKSDKRATIEKLLLYPVGTAGAAMSLDFFSVPIEATVEEATASLRDYPGKDSVLYIYVLQDKRLVGVVPLRGVVLSPARTPVRDLMATNVVTVNATSDQERAAQMVGQYNLLALPVVNDNGEMLGIITVDDVIDIFQEQATEDIQKFGGMEVLDEPYMVTSLVHMIQKRASWLIILFLSEMLTATAMGFFEKTIQRAVVLALFVPLIISSGGNSGSQASTLVIRALALGELKLRDWWRVMRREIYSGLALGLLLGMIGFLRISVWSAFSDIYGPHWLAVAFTVGFALIGVVLWGTVTGSMLPFVISRLGFDPATSSAPFVATLVDVTGLVIYFTVATLLLSGTLL